MTNQNQIRCTAGLRSSTYEILCRTTLLTHGSRHSARGLVRHTDRCLGHPSAALQDSFEIVTKQVALRSNEFLRRSATHEGVHSLYIVIQTLSAKPGEFAGEALQGIGVSLARLHRITSILRDDCSVAWCAFSSVKPIERATWLDDRPATCETISKPERHSCSTAPLLLSKRSASAFAACLAGLVCRA